MVVEVFVFLLEADLDLFLGLPAPAVDAVAVPDRIAEAGEKNCGLAAMVVATGEEEEEEEESGEGCDGGCSCR